MKHNDALAGCAAKWWDGGFFAGPHGFLVTLFLVGSILSSGCHVEKPIADFLEGCGDPQDFLVAESLEQVDGKAIVLGPLQFQAAEGTYFRAGQAEVSVFQGVYCDSGDWGINTGNQVRVKLYDGPAPAGFYSDPPKEQARALETMAASTGRLEYDTFLGNYHWRVQLEVWGQLVPSIRTAYLIAGLGSRTVAVSFVAEIGAPADPSALLAVVRSIEERGGGRSTRAGEPSSEESTGK